MSDDAIIRAKLGLDTTGWKADTASAAADVKRLTPELANAKANVTAMERAMRAVGGGTAEARAQLKQYQQVLSQIKADLGRAKKAQEEYTAAKAATSQPPPGPSEAVRFRTIRSERERDHAERMRQTQRHTKDFSKARQQAIREAQAEEEKILRTGGPASASGGGGGSGGEESEGGGGNNRFRNMELGHVARSVVDSLAAGQSPLRIIGQEAPRVLQAFGSSIGALLKGLSVGAAGAAGAILGLGFAISKAGEAARERGEVLQNAGLPNSSIRGDTQSSAVDRIEELTASH